MNAISAWHIDAVLAIQEESISTLERSVTRLWWRAASALRYFALASRWMHPHAAAQLHR